MRTLAILGAVALLSACASPATPEQMAGQSDYEVCRFTMGGLHSQAAHYIAKQRGLDCTPYYAAINARLQAQNDAINGVRQSLQPRQRARPAPPVTCNSQRVGNQVRTDCY